MKKLVAIIIFICITAVFCLPAFSLTLDDYEPYSKSEFPKWSLDLRRAECLFFGGIPIAYPLTSLALGLANQELSFMQTLGIACSVSAVVTIIDYILGVINEN